MAAIKHRVVLDYESYWDRNGVSLRNLSVPEYIFHQKFQVHLLAAYDLTWDGPKIILPDDIPAFLASYPPEETEAIAHNMLFDGAISAWKYNWLPARLTDTLGMVRALKGFKKNSLGAVAEQLFGYDSKGDVIYKVAGMDVQAIKNAGLWPYYCTYALQDAKICMGVYARLINDFPAEEHTIMDLVQRAALDPVLHVDQQMLQLHLNDVRKEKLRLLQECGYDKAALMSTKQFQTALEDLGVEVKRKTSATGNWVPQFSKTDPFMAELLEHENTRVQALAMARLSHRSTIEETRCQRFLNVAFLPWPSGQPLLPVPLRYGGAHTHRLSGEWGMNLQNLPRDTDKSKLRLALKSPPGYKLITADLAQIEARMVARLCGQEDLIEQFRRGDDVYANFASTVFSTPVTKRTHPHLRFIGKTAVLGLGYGCGATRFYKMVVAQAQQYNIPLEGIFDANIAYRTVNTYRKTFRHIEATWYDFDEMLRTVIRYPRAQEVALDKRTWGPVVCIYSGIALPNRMFLRYPLDAQNDLYGAKILENVTQALARIVVMQAAVRLAERGQRFVMQGHDELVFMVKDDQVEKAKTIIVEEMVREPEWLDGLPLAVEIGVGDNYGEAK